MELPAEVVEGLFQLSFIELELSWKVEKAEVIDARRDWLNLAALGAEVLDFGNGPAVITSVTEILLSLYSRFGHS